MRVICLPSALSASAWYRLRFPGIALRKQFGWTVVEPQGILTAVPDDGKGKAQLKRLRLYGRWEPDGQGKMRCVEALEDQLLSLDFDVLVMHQRREPFDEVIRQLRAQGKRVLIDSDDPWFDLPVWNPGSRMTRDELVAMAAQLRACDGLSVATPALARMYGGFQPNTRVIRNRLDWGMWADTTPVYERPSRRVRVGWMGDTFWRKGDLKVLRDCVRPWLLEHPEVEFVAAGDPRTHDLVGVPESQRVSVAEVEFDNRDLADITATFDIGLVPLDMSTKKARSLNECKSHLKGLEYNACGVPFVATPTESYRWYLEDGGAGLLAANPAQWREALTDLLDDAYRGQLGREGRIAAREHSIQGAADEWADWLSCGTHTDAPVALLAA